MNVTFENDFEKKMALVGLLKQYAENRDIGQFSKALAVVLSDPKHRKLVYDIRWASQTLLRTQYTNRGVFQNVQLREQIKNTPDKIQETCFEH